MPRRNLRYRPPKGYMECPKLRAAYEENGQGLGRLYLWYPEEAIKAWKMLGGVLGPKWMLEVFRFHWKADNPLDYERWKKWRYNERQRKLKRDKQSGKLDK